MTWQPKWINRHDEKESVDITLVLVDDAGILENIVIEKNYSTLKQEITDKFLDQEAAIEIARVIQEATPEKKVEDLKEKKASLEIQIQQLQGELKIVDAKIANPDSAQAAADAVASAEVKP